MIKYLIFSVFLLLHVQPEQKKSVFPKKLDRVENVPAKSNTWVFVMAGQSNMAGRGVIEPQDTIPHERIFSINKEGGLIYAKEPLHFYEPTMVGLDCSLSFARRLVRNLPDSISVLLIPTAIGGSSSSQWLQDDHFRGVNLYSNFEEKIALAKAYGDIKAILWHQGESDARDERIPVYEENLKMLFGKFRSTIGNKALPILVGEVGTLTNTSKKEAINKIIHRVADDDGNMVVVETGDLSFKPDSLHFDSRGQRLLGEKYAETFLRSFMRQ